jgi:hypothetical protein
MNAFKNRLGAYGQHQEIGFDFQAVLTENGGIHSEL